jgi:hypothetical protein
MLFARLAARALFTPGLCLRALLAVFKVQKVIVLWIAFLIERLLSLRLHKTCIRHLRVEVLTFKTAHRRVLEVLRHELAAGDVHHLLRHLSGVVIISVLGVEALGRAWIRHVIFIGGIHWGYLI